MNNTTLSPSAVPLPTNGDNNFLMSAPSMPSDASSWAVLIVAVLICFVVIHPVTIRIPLHYLLGSEKGSKSLTVNYLSGSVFGLLFLHFFDVISFRTMLLGMWRSGSVQPWAVIIIFFTLAYASISLDVTGFSKFVALSVLQRYGGTTPKGRDDDDQQQLSKGAMGTVEQKANTPTSDGTTRSDGNAQLVVVVYLLSGVLALIASNDVVILTLTPVLIHYCAIIGRDPKIFLYAEYHAANTFSTFLIVGNPTNIIIGQGTGINFVTYFTLMFLPTIVMVIASVMVFHRLVSAGWLAPAAASTTMHLKAKTTTVRHSSAIMERENGLTVCSDARKREGGWQTLVDIRQPSIDLSRHVVDIPQSEACRNTSELLMDLPPPLQRNDVVRTERPPQERVQDHDRLHETNTKEQHCEENQDHVVSSNSNDDDQELLRNPRLALLDPSGALFRGVVLCGGVLFLIVSSYTAIPLVVVTSVMCVLMLLRDLCSISTDPPSSSSSLPSTATTASEGTRPSQMTRRRVWQVVHRMPWDVAPFAISMFILVDLLAVSGWTKICSVFVVQVAEKVGVFGCSTLGTLVSIVLVNVLNNQPGSIFLANVLQDARGGLTPSVVSALIASVSLASNIGALYTLPGALAGFMWSAILREYHIEIPWKEFFLIGIQVEIIPTVIAMLTIWIQVNFLFVVP